MRRTIKILLGCSLAFALLPVGHADDRPAQKKERSTRPQRSRGPIQIKELSVTGTIEAKELKRKDKNTGELKTMTRYILIDKENNTVFLPRTRKGDQNNPADYVGKTVVLKGKGSSSVRTRQGKQKTVINIQEITGITPADGDAGGEEAQNLEGE